jgi:hypothetical protein
MWIIAGYQVKNGVLQQAPCCCHADDHTSHFGCQTPTEEVLAAERNGLIVRRYDAGVWQWHVVEPQRERMTEADDLLKR